MLNGELLGKGRVGFYKRKNKKYGIKVFYSFAWAKAQKLSYVKTIFKKWEKLYNIGICTKPLKIVKVDVNILFRNKRHKASAYGIKTYHVNYDEKAWMDYIHGYPYRFDICNEPWHTPEGYKKFVASVKRKIKKAGIKLGTGYKIGDVVPDMVKKRYFVVDVDLG